MAEYYIRTPDRDESRGPFTPAQLLTLAEAEQVDINTLYYNDFKEEWLPIATNPELKEQVFPKKEKLKLKIDKPEDAEEKTKKKKKKKKDAKEKVRSTVSDMLAVAENDTKHARSKRKQEKSFERANFITSNGLCLIMLLSAATLLVPHLTVMKEITSDRSTSLKLILNYPLIIVGLLDLIMSIYVYFGDRKLNPILRVRAMLALGFGVYIGWALDDLYILLASASFGLGTLWSTLSRRFLSSILAVALGFGGSAVLAYLALSGYFNGFLESVQFEFFTSE